MTWWQGRFTTRHAIVLQLGKDWDSEEMVEKRKTAAIALQHKEPQNSASDAVLDFFETLAFYERRNTLPLELVWHQFHYWAVRYWFAARMRVEHQQSAEESTWEDFEDFVPRLLNFEAYVICCQRFRKTHPTQRVAFYLLRYLAPGLVWRFHASCHAHRNECQPSAIEDAIKADCDRFLREEAEDK